MKITKVEPLLLDRFLYVRVHTDAGIVGLGESGTWGQLEASAASIAKYGEYLVGKDPFPIEHHWNVMLRGSSGCGRLMLPESRARCQRRGFSRDVRMSASVPGGRAA